MILKFGKYKGKDTNQVPTEYLEWLMTNQDLSDPKYAVSNQQLVNACADTINSRTDGHQKGPKAELPTIQLKKPGKEALIRSVQSLIESLYTHASEMQKLLDEHKSDGTVVTSKSEFLPR